MKKVTAALKPARDGLIVINPDTRMPLPQEGATVRLTPYWRHRIRDCSVVAVDDTSKPETKTKP